MPKKKASNRSESLRNILEVSEAALTGVGVPGVEAGVKVLLKLVEYYEEVKANREDMNNLIANLDSLRGAVLAPMYEAKQHGVVQLPVDVVTRIEKLFEEIDKLCDSLKPFVSLSLFDRIRKKNDISSAVQNVDREINQALIRFQARATLFFFGDHF